ncbi:MAG: DNA repair protein RecN, partial [Ruminococcus sp.]|nr:DNA repair protein RecN [Ruminococcus sp.]
LDSFADAEDYIADYRQSFRELQAVARKINKIKLDANQRAYQINQLEQTIDEIEQLRLKENEDEEIARELEVSKNAVVISEAIYNAVKLLEGDDDTSGAADLAKQAEQSLEEDTEIYEKLEPLHDRLLSAGIELADIATELSATLDKLNVDPKRYDYLNQRNDDIRKIKKKYGPELSDVMETLEKSREELEQLAYSEESLAELNAEQSELLKVVSKKAKALSEYRRQAGERFISRVTEELEFLNMPKVKLQVLQKPGKLTVNGMDTIEFLISANVGEEPKPIAKIASGGELSRIMLALRNVIAEKDSIPTLIFDEIDTGVSGKAAGKIGMKLKQIASIRQVLCVTHLSQIAVMADNHLLIEKNIVGERTVTSVKALGFDERKYEIARIMGGDNVTELMLENAKQLLETYNC